MPGESAGEAALRQLHEGLEQPGWPRHYHFAIHYCNEALWKSRREDPWAIEQMELLCWLDIQLIEAYPDAISFESDAETQYANVDAFYRLIKLYENDGYLHEALDVARRAVGFKQAQNYFASLQERIRQLETEDAH